MIGIKKNDSPAIFQSSLQGFTLVEVIVTLGVVSLFITLFFQLYLTMESQRLYVARQAYASDVANTNIHKVSARPAALTQAVCTSNAADMDLTTGNPATKPGLDITQYGYTLESNTTVRQSLGSTATQALVAYAPAGCTNFDSNPVKIVSSVTFGTNGDKVVHAVFIK
jgi:prepilin-type N-terminal cleavage/methylation domain-containing protein